MKCHSPPTQSPDPRSCRQGSCLWVGAALPAYLPFIPLHLISWSPMVQVAMSAVLPSSKRVPFSAMFRMTNYLQLISGYLELEDYTKAANNIVAISTTPGTENKNYHVVRDDYANMLDITGLITKATGDRKSTRLNSS